MIQPYYKDPRKGVDYGEFVAKPILSDHLTQTRSWSRDRALGHPPEEFVNQEPVPGRHRRYAGILGLLFFCNFKIRSVKVAHSVIRNNPFHALMTNIFLPEVRAQPWTATWSRRGSRVVCVNFTEPGTG